MDVEGSIDADANKEPLFIFNFKVVSQLIWGLKTVYTIIRKKYKNKKYND